MEECNTRIKRLLELQTGVLGLIRDVKGKWKMRKKNKIPQLNQCIAAETVKITSLNTISNEISSQLQKVECERQTANAELDAKLRVFQAQYKKSLAKSLELNRQSVQIIVNRNQGVEIKLKEISAHVHNQITVLRTILDFEAAKNTDLETRSCNEQDSNHCRKSRLDVAIVEQLCTIQAMLSARDAEIETLHKQLQEREKRIDDLKTSAQMLSLQKQLEIMNLENEQLKQ